MFIDQKGRLFGKINILDILFVIILIAVMVFAYGFLAGRSGGSATLPVTYTVEIQNRESAYFNHVNTDEQVTDGVTKAPMGRIVGFSKEPARVLTQADDKMVISTPEDRYDGYVKIEAEVQVEYPDMLLGGESLKIGKQLVLRSETLAMRGYIVDIDYDFDQLRRMK